MARRMARRFPLRRLRSFGLFARGGRGALGGLRMSATFIGARGCVIGLVVYFFPFK